jgi:hypothetical protein
MQQNCPPITDCPRITDWNTQKYAGEPPEQKFLLEDIFPLGVPCLLAASGDTGKGLLSLDLALKVTASDDTQSYCLGKKVAARGKAVVFAAEDDQAEVHRRLKRLDPDQCYMADFDRLYIIPLPNAGGPLPIVQATGKGKPQRNPAFCKLEEQLYQMEDLQLIIFDPLSSFVQADITTDPATGSLLMGLLAGLATKTGACVIISHHMRKPQGNYQIQSPEQARDAIRGTSALVDGVRCAYAIWPYPSCKREAVFKSLAKKPEPNALFQGAVVKSNGKADKTTHTLWRNEIGLLEDVTALNRIQERNSHDLHETLLHTIIEAAQNGKPFAKTGKNGIYENRNSLPKIFHGMGRDKLEKMVQIMLDKKNLVKGCGKGTTNKIWLDEPEGDFAKGVGVLL